MTVLVDEDVLPIPIPVFLFTFCVFLFGPYTLMKWSHVNRKVTFYSTNENIVAYDIIMKQCRNSSAVCSQKRPRKTNIWETSISLQTCKMTHDFWPVFQYLEFTLTVSDNDALFSFDHVYC